jgi:hypothetical protein
MSRLAPLVLIAVFLGAAPAAHADNFVVNNSADPNNTTGSCASAGTCSLRQAVNSANANGATADVITFSVSAVTVTSGPSNMGIVNVGGPLTIDGGSGVTISATGGAHIFDFQPPAASTASTLKNLTLQGIPAGDGGGALHVGGSGAATTNTVTLDHVTVQNNTTSGTDGGGVLVSTQGATLNVVDSTFAGNTAPSPQRGGAIAAAVNAKVNVSRSLFTNNTGTIGGALAVDNTSLAVVVNSTFSGNQSPSGDGSAVYDGGDQMSISYSTFTANTGPANSGAFESVVGGGNKFKGNIFTGNSPANCEVTSRPATSGFNFDSGSTCVSGANVNDHPNTAIALVALAENGGPTKTHALPPGSLAIDAGGLGGCTTAAPVAALTTDQRGTSRPQDAGCDSGAYEFVSPPQNTVAPAISGSAEVGQVLTCSQGTWSGGTPQTYAFVWRRDGADIGAATNNTYTVVSADAGHALTCRVTATNSAGNGSATSAAANVPAASGGGVAPGNSAPPAITGTPRVGEVLTCAPGTWTGSTPQTYGFTWLRDGSPIAGETNGTHTAVAADRGHALTCRVVATNSFGTATADSTAVNVSVPVVVVPDTTKPVLTKLVLAARAFRARAGTDVSFALSEAAKVRFAAQRKTKRRGKTRWVSVGSLSRQGSAGANRFHFNGRVKGKRLTRGSYRLSVVATDAAGNKSRAATKAFRVVR